MPKHNQSATIGPITDFVSPPSPVPESERITALENRVSTLETLLNDVMHQLDKPNTQPKSKMNGKPKDTQKSKPLTPKPKKAQPKKIAPSEIIKALLKHKPQSRSEMEAETGLDTEAVKKCVTWMSKKDFIEKTKDKDSEGNSRWSLKE